METLKNFQITDPEVQRTAIELEHQRQMVELELRKLEAENERRRLDLVSKNSVFGRDVEFQQRLLNRFNELITEFAESCQKSTWHYKELKDFLARANDLKTKIETYCNARYIKPETLQLYQNLKKLIEFTKASYDSMGAFQHRLTFDLCDKSRKNWERMQLQSFDVATITEIDDNEEFLEN
jgi:sugar-specific transcriptional regulator TrmB